MHPCAEPQDAATRAPRMRLFRRLLYTACSYTGVSGSLVITSLHNTSCGHPPLFRKDMGANGPQLALPIQAVVARLRPWNSCFSVSLSPSLPRSRNLLAPISLPSAARVYSLMQMTNKQSKPDPRLSFCWWRKERERKRERERGRGRERPET